MRVHHGVSILVTDGSKALFLTNEGDGDFPDFQLVQKWEQEVPADHELRSAGPGHAFSSYEGSSRRSSYDETDFHEQVKVQFTANIAAFLNERARLGSIDELIMVAPPRTLGELRKHIRRDVADRLRAEIAKDLVKQPIAAVEQLLARYPEPGEPTRRQ
jgi:protein required for attachment to host cells